MEQQMLKEVTQAQIEAIWKTLTHVVLPAIGGLYLGLVGIARWIYNELKELRTNDLAHIQKEFEGVNKRLERLEHK